MKGLNRFEKSINLQNLISLIIEYLIENPPTLGHGFSHFIKTARTAYKIAQKNKADEANLEEQSYIAGLLHDIHRPALGEAGKEKHEEKGSLIAMRILQTSNYSEIAERLSLILKGKDEQILNDNAELLTTLLSVADKIEMSNQRGVAYTWASNRELKKQNKPIVYHNFLEVMRDFAIYQVKAWKIFNKVEIKGVNAAIDSYIKSNNDLLNLVKLESLNNINYKNESLKIAKKEAILELELD